MYRLAILCVLVASAVAGPFRASGDRCAKTCTDNNKFSYEEGRTYEYTYRSKVRTMINGTSNEQAGVSVVANVQMEVLSKCEFSMRLSDVVMSQTEAIRPEINSEFSSSMEKNPTRFAFQDGLVEELCVAEDEPAWVLNVKRAILSVFQNTMEDWKQNHTASESDVAGECVTHYAPHEESSWFNANGPITITKTKELSGCTGRHGYNSAVQGVAYNAQSDIQALPILKSNHECQHKIDSSAGYLMSAECHESHLFRPFSSNSSGIVTVTNQYLNFVKSSRGTKSPVKPTVKKPITFDHDVDAKTLESNRKDITRRLQQVCDSTQDGVRPETPHMFTDIVYRLRTLDSNTISEIYRLLSDDAFCKGNKERTRKFFLDALPMAGTAASLNMMTSLITRKVITGTEADMWITSLAFIKHPTQEMLKEVKPLINMAEIEGKALLSVGTLVHTYCYHHGNCERDTMVSAIVSAFTNKMGRGCKVNNDNLKTILFALRGLGNIGYIERALPVVQQCLKVVSNPIEVRLSAIEAFRRVPCGGERKQVVKLFTDVDEDSEIRIAAYHALMQCPSEGILKLVVSALEREPIKQVGSYVWSHLTNLQETSDPHRQELRATLEKLTLNGDFDLDKMKYSRNYEGSIFLDKFNTGAKVEGDVIWSTNSFIPRSGMVNLTVDLFGHSVNLFEIGSRVEGLEYFLEKFFGPNGYFGDTEERPSSEIALKNGDKKLLSKIDRFNTKMAELRGSMYMRVFGNELQYTQFEGVEDLMSGGSGFNVLDLMVQLSKDNDYTYSHSTMFLDSSIIVPTGAGFPMNLTVNGTATVDLRIKGKMDLSNPPTVDIVGFVQPSAAVSVSSIMSVDTFASKTGVKMVSTLHTNTAFEGKINVNEAGVVSAQYDLPRKGMEIIDFKSSIFNLHNDVEIEQMEGPQNSQISCTPQSLITVLGVEMCAEVSYPETSTPFLTYSGPVSGGVYLYNRDTITTYTLKARSTHTSNQNIIQFELDTPKSQIDRRISVDLSLNKVTKNLEMSLHSPWADANMKGKIINTKPLKSLTGELSIDGSKKFDFNAQLAFARENNAYVYRPSMVINSHKAAPVSLKGMLKYNGLRQVELEMTTSGISPDSQVVKVTLINRPNQMSVLGELSPQKGKTYSLNMKTSILQTKTKFSLEPMLSVRSPQKELVAFGGSMEYIYGKKLSFNLALDKIVAKAITVKGMVLQIAKKRGRVIHRITYVMDTPVFDTNMLLKLDNRNWRSVTADLTLSYVIPKVIRDKVKLAVKIIDYSSSSLTKGRANINLNLKQRPHLNTRVITNFEHNKKLTKLDIDVNYGNDFKNKSRTVDVAFTMNRQIKSLTDASVTMDTRLNIPALEVKSILKGSHKHTGKELDTSLELRVGKAYAVKSILRLRDETKKMLKVSGEYNVNYNGHEMVVNHTLEQKTDTLYLSTLNGQYKKGKKNSIITTFGTKGGKGRVIVTSDIILQSMDPVKLEAEVDLHPTDFITRLAYERLSKRYEATVASVTLDTETTLNLDLKHPDRNILFDMSVMDKDGRYGLKSGLKWNAIRDNKQAVMMSAWLEHPTASKLNGSLTLKYPSRQITLNANSLMDSKNSGHLDIQWAKNQKLATDVSFKMVKNKVLGTASVTTPFKILSKVVVDLNHDDGKDEYFTNLDVAWNASETVSLKLNLKKPFNLRTFVGSIDLRTSRKQLKRARIEVDHKHSTPLASVTTSAKVLYNRDSIKVDIHLQNKTKGPKVGYEGSMDVQTTFPMVKKGEIRLTHNNNGRKFTTAASFRRNKKRYSVEKTLTHTKNANGFENTGSLVVMTPRETYDSAWTIDLSAQDIRSTLKTSWGRKGKNIITLKMNGGLKDSINADISLETPFKSLETASLEMLLKKHTNSFESRIAAQSNKNQHLFGEVTANRRNTDVEGVATLKVPTLDLNLSVAGNSSYPEPNNLYSFVELKLSQELTFSLARDFSSNDKSTHHTVSFSSSLPGYESIILTNRLNTQDYNVKLQYGRDKAIEASTKLIVEQKERLISLLLKTPFSVMPRFESEVVFKGHLQDMEIDASVEMVPTLPRTTVTGQWGFSKQKIILGFDMDRLMGNAVNINFNIDGRISERESHLVVKGEYLQEQLNCKISLKNDNDAPSLLVELSSPVGSLNVQQSGPLRSFSNSVSLTSIAGKTYAVKSSFYNIGRMVGSLTVSIPGRRDIKAEFTHQGSNLQFNTHAEITHNRKNSFFIDVNSAIAKELTLSLKSSLSTEILPITDNDFEADLSFNGNLSKFNSRAEFVSRATGTTETVATFDATSDIDASMIFKSKLAKNIKASFNHHFKNNYWQCKSQVIRGGVNILDILGSLDAESQVRGEVSLKTMWSKDFKLVVTADGEKTNFNIRTQGTYGTNKANMDMTSQSKPRFSKHTINIQATGMKNINCEIGHTGLLSNVKALAKVSVGSDIHMVEGSFKNGASVGGSLSISSPMTYPVHVSFTHTGQMANFESSGELIIAEDKTEISASFKKTPGLEGNLMFSSSYGFSFNGQFSHHVRTPSMSSTALLSINKNKLLDLKTSFTNDRAVSGSISMKSSVLTPLEASFRHNGPLTDMQNEVEFTLGSMPKTSIHLDILAEEKYSGLLTVQNMKGMPDVEVILKHSGQIKNFLSSAEVTIDGETRSVTKGMIRASLGETIDTSVSFEAPFIQSVAMNLKHGGDLKKFTTHADIRLGDEKSEADISSEVALPTIETTINIKSPYIEDISGTFTSNGPINALTTQGVVVVGGKVSQATLNVNHAGNTFTSKITTNSPHTEDITINFRHDGEASNFLTHGDISLGNVFSEFDASSNIPENKISFSVKSPKISTKFVHNGDIKNFKTSFEFMNMTQVYSAEMKLNTEGIVEASVKLQSPKEGYRTISGLYTHAGEPTNFQCQGEWTVEEVKSTANLNVNIAKLDDVKISIEAQSPQTQVKGRVEQSYNKQSYNAVSDLTVNGDVLYTLTAVARNESEQEIKLELQTESNSHYLLHVTSEEFASHHQLTKGELVLGSVDNKASTSYTRRPNLIDFKVNMNSGILPNIQSVLHIEGSPLKYSSNANLKISEHGLTVRHDMDLMDKVETSVNVEVTSGKHTAESDVSFSKTPKSINFQASVLNNTQELFKVITKVDLLTASVSLTSAVPHPLSFNADVSGTSWADSLATVSVTHKGQLIFSSRSSIDFSISPLNMTSSFRVNDIVLETGLEKRGNGFTSNAKLAISSKIWSADVSFENNLPKTISTNVAIQSPVWEPIRASIAYRKQPFKTMANGILILTSTDKYTVDLELKTRKMIEGQVSVTTPLDSLKSVVLDFNHQGDFPNMKSNADLSYNTNKHFIASVTLQHDGSTSGKITVNTPFDGLETTDVSFYKNGPLSNFKTGGRVQYAMGEEVSLDLEHVLFETTVKSKARFMSPYTDEIVVGLNHTSSPSSLDTKFELAMGEDNKLSADISLKSGHNYLSASSKGEAIMAGEPFTAEMSLSHEGPLENFRTTISAEAMKQRIEMNTDFKLLPVLTGSVELITPFENFTKTSLSISHSGSSNGFLSKGEINYANSKVIKGKIDFLNLGLKRIVATAELTTPFLGYEKSRVSYQHVGDHNSFQCDTEADILANKVTGMVKASKKPLSIIMKFNSPFEGLKNIGLSGDFNNMNRDITTRGRVYWAKDKLATFEANYSPSYNKIEGSASLTTPFEIIRDATAEFTHQKSGNSFLQSMKVFYNSATVLDVDLDCSIPSQPQHSLVISMREPVSAKFEGRGLYTTDRLVSEMSLKWDDIERMRMEAGIDAKSVNFLLADKTVTFSFKAEESNALLTWGLDQENRAGYEITRHADGGKLKVILPSRSVELNASHRQGLTDGTLAWDADRDMSKKVNFNLKTSNTNGLYKSSLSLAFPSLTKSFELESEVMMNQGRVLFGGKTELSLSQDPSKKFVISSQLKDVSMGSLKNYSFNMEMSHPYTTLGVKLGSYFGRGDQTYSAGAALEYLTTRRRMETFRISGDIDKLKKTMSMELQSPVKSVSISGSARTDDGFQVSLQNVYDNNQPMKTYFSVTPGYLSFFMNYDLDNPRNALHMNAGYVNSSAMKAEVFHMINGAKTTDALATLRLNSSQLLHSRLHWKPELFQELEVYQDRKLREYAEGMDRVSEEVMEAVIEEGARKSALIFRYLKDTIGEEYTNMIKADLTERITYTGMKKSSRFVSSLPVPHRQTQMASNYISDMRMEDMVPMVRARFDQAAELLQVPRQQLPYKVTNGLAYMLNNSLPVDVMIKLQAINARLDVSAHTEEALESIMLAVEDELLKVLREVEETMLDVLHSQITVYDPQHGEIQLELHSPIPLVSLDVLPVVAMEQYVAKVVSYLEVEEKIESPKEQSNEWLPPFSGVARIEKGRKITTFDGFVYDLDEGCSYILAKDFIDKNFTLALTNSDKTMLTLQFSTQTLEITVGEEILLNGKPLSLPYKVNGMSIEATSEGIKIELPGNHMTIVYDMSVDHITVNLNGWYFGKTAGLLGTFDNEPSNDLMTPYNKVINNSRRFSKLWRVAQC